MELVRFDHGGTAALGVVTGSGIADLTSADPSLGSDMVELVRRWDHDAIVAAAGAAPVRDPATVRRLAPLLPRRNVIAVGRNVAEHAVEFSASGFDASEKAVVPDHPVVFTKAPTSVIGPGEAIVLANDPTGTTDYEGELGVVIGTRCRDVPAEDALTNVFGWTVVNDVTARELQRRHVQWFVGKSPDTFCPIGPCIVTADALPDIRTSTVTTVVNGEQRQRYRVADLVFSVEHLIATLSAVMTLEPGDLIAMGTGPGVGMGMTPPRYLAPGDVVEVTISGIGTLRNTAV